MSDIANAVQEFLTSLKWHWQELEGTRYRVVVYGNTASWVWIARWDEDDSYFAGYCFSPVKVPVKQRAAAAEYLTRANYNLRLGNFEMDYSDGEVSFRTSMVMEGVHPTADLVKELAFSSFRLMDRYLPGLMSVVYGKARPKAAIEEAERPKKKEPRPDDDPEDDPAGSPPARSASAGAATAQASVARRRSGITREKRVIQFAEYLRLMQKRVHEEAKGSCFLIFSRPEVPATARREQKHQGATRMVQFCFEKKWFAIDLPSTHLSPDDAQKILKERRGFYREAEHPEAGVTTDVNDLVQYDPVGRKYIYGDEQEAAEDAAYIFYSVWGLSPDAELLVTASAFEGDNWEKDVPLK